MNKTQLMQAVAKQTGMSEQKCSLVFNAVCEQIGIALMDDEEVTLTGVGKLKIQETAERTGRNPRTGEPITIPAGKKVKFVIAKALKESL